MESIKQTVNSAKDAVTQGGKEQSAAASKEANKNQAQDSNAGLGQRASVRSAHALSSMPLNHYLLYFTVQAGLDALSDKKDETAAGAQKDQA